MTDDPLTSLKNVIRELESWCNKWVPDTPIDPRVSLRQISDRAKASIPSDKHDVIVVLKYVLPD